VLVVTAFQMVGLELLIGTLVVVEVEDTMAVLVFQLGVMGGVEAQAVALGISILVMLVLMVETLVVLLALVLLVVLLVLTQALEVEAVLVAPMLVELVVREL